MRLEPTGNHLIVRREEAEETTAGGIVLPDAAKEKPRIGRVLSVGDGDLLRSGERRPMDVFEGDRVLFQAWAGTEIHSNDESLLVLRESDVLAILN